MSRPASFGHPALGAQATAAILVDARLVAIIRTDRREFVVPALERLAAGGIRAAEISLATDNSLRLLQIATEAIGDRLLLGAGTVRSTGDAERALEAGARFLVSPGFDPGVVRLARDCDVLHLPGVLTPTELGAALTAGADLVKLFPAGRCGPGYMRDLLAPFPEARLVPTGGITPASAGKFLAAGAVAVAVGSALVDADSIADVDVLGSRLSQFAPLITSAAKEERSNGT